MKGKSILAVISFLFIFSGTSSATEFYQVTDLWATDAYAMGINKYNQVTGYVAPGGSMNNSYAFLWSARNGLTSLGGYKGSGINDLGQIAGQICSPNHREVYAAVWENGAWISLEGRQGASAINNNGQVTGLISAQPYIPGPYAAFRDDDIYSPGFIELPRPSSGAVEGYGINIKGEIVASGMFYDQYGSYTILQGAPRGINDLGQIVGYSNSLAVFWDSYNSSTENMGSLGSGSSVAYAINNLGQAVGYSANKAFLWTHDGGMVDLNTLIDPGLGITLTVAKSINDYGSITAWGIDSLGQNRSFLLTPEPGTVLLLGLGGLLIRKQLAIRCPKAV